MALPLIENHAAGGVLDSVFMHARDAELVWFSCRRVGAFIRAI